MATKEYIALLRGVNVGGSGVLKMAELKALAEELRFENARTYIQSGNLIFSSELGEAAIVEKLEASLENKMGKHITVMARSAVELAGILKGNPFPKEDPAKVGVMFFSKTVARAFLTGISTSTGEKVKPGKREIYIHYPSGMGRSKLKLPKDAEAGTVRNINTLRKVMELCQSITTR